MRIVFNKKELAHSIEHCMTCIEKKTTMPILVNILLETEDGNINITSTNLETSVKTHVNYIELEGSGTIAIPAKQISDITKVSKGDTILFDYDDQHSLLNITADKSKYSIPCPDYNDFPTVVEGSEDGTTIDIEKLTSLFKKLQFSMTDTNINKSYSGILINRVEENNDDDDVEDKREYKKRIELVTTDVHRIGVLILNNLDIDIAALEEGIVVLGKNFAEIGKIFTGKENVTLSITDGKIIIKSKNITFISRILKNEFPNYKSVTGTEEFILKKPFTIINRKELMDGIKRTIALSTEEKIWATKLEFKGNLLTLSANSGFGSNSSDQVVLEKPFKEDKVIGINARYLLDVLAIIDSPEVHIIVEEGLRPLTVVEKSENSFFTHMIMPLRI